MAMKRYTIMIKPASSLCNLRCKYCFYHDISAHREVASRGIMPEETAEAIIENLFTTLQKGDVITLAFQGGEPTLAGLPYYKHFIDSVGKRSKEITVSYALQTNGILLDEEWCSFLRENRFLVGLSMDAYADHHDVYRIDAHKNGTFKQVASAKRLLDKAGVEYNILCTLTKTLARHPQKAWRFLMSQDIRFVQFTPCLNEIESTTSEWALTPQHFHQFYTSLYPLWKQAVQQGRYISVKLFDDIANMFVRKEVTACGMHGHCQPQCVIEADGSVYPCDFYAADMYCGGSLAEQTLEKALKSLVDTGFLTARDTLPSICHACGYHKMCNGGCKRMFLSVYVDEATGFCGFQRLLNDIGQDLCSIGARLLGQ